MYYSLAVPSGTELKFPSKISSKLQLFSHCGHAPDCTLVFVPLVTETFDSQLPQILINDDLQWRCIIQLTGETHLKNLQHKHQQKRVLPCDNRMLNILPVSKIRSATDKSEPDSKELPTCAACLSRLDTSTTGLKLLTCSDIYHECCIAVNSTRGICPVCNLINSPQSHISCKQCGSEEDCWICLICGVVGCGRYKGGHAYDHFEQTQHAFVLQPSSRCIWDYREDRYVHRIQDQVVEDASAITPWEQDDFTNAQLDSQRLYYESKIKSVAKLHDAELARIRALNEENAAGFREAMKENVNRLHALSESKLILTKKLENLMHENDVLKKDLETEKSLSEALTAKIRLLEDQVKESGSYNSELQEQILDLMKHFDTLQLVQDSGNNPDIVQGRIVLSKAPSQKPKKTSGKR